MGKTILIDCYGLFYKAYYAFIKNPLINSKGEETSVIFSFFNSLYKLIQERDHEHLVCILDSKGKTIRHEMFKDYKAQRPPMPDPLSKQIKIIIELLDLLGIPIVQKTSLEADDLIAYYAQQSAQDNQEVEIFSHDKDLMQLVDDKVQVIQLDRQNREYIIFNSEQVEEKYQVPPEHIVDYLSLMGDSSDNIPGVKGIGDKTAVMLIKEYGGLNSIYEKLDAIPEKFRKKLIEGKDSAFISRDLISLKNQSTRLDASLTKDLPTLESLNYKPCQSEQARQLWEDHECTSLVKKYLLLPPMDRLQGKTILEIIKQTTITAVDENHLEGFNRHVLDRQRWSELIKAIRSQGRFVFDLETTSLVPFDAQVVSAVFVLPDKSSYYLPIVTQTNDDEAEWLKTFQGIFEDDKIKKIGHNLKFDYSILKQKNVEVRGMEHDTMIHAYMKEPDLNAYKLEDLVKKNFGVDKLGYSQMSKGYENILSIPNEVLQEYTFEDGEYTFLIYQSQIDKYPLSEKEEDIFKNWEMPLLVVLANMELTGVTIDKKYLKNLEKILRTSLSSTEKEIYQLAGEEFNINSTKQLQVILFEKLNIPPIKKTKTGYSTDNYVLEKLNMQYPIAESLLQYRKTIKLLNTYVEALPKLIHPKTNRIHTSYNQSVTATGRLSSTDPNLQNIPISNGAGGIRHAFIVDPGYEIISIDYSQVELRIAGFLSQDKKLLGAYQKNQDIHTQTAHLLFGKPMEEVTGEERNIAKTINFSVIYGISAFSLGEDLKVPRSDAQFFIDTFFANYPQLKNYQEEILHKVRTQGWVETYFGRRRYIQEINSDNMIVKNRAERIAFNTVIQGTASDIIKRAMVNIQKEIADSPVKMVMQVHDELVFYSPSESVTEIVPVLEKKLIDIKPFDGILTVNTKIGKHWG